MDKGGGSEISSTLGGDERVEQDGVTRDIDLGKDDVRQGKNGKRGVAERCESETERQTQCPAQTRQHTRRPPLEDDGELLVGQKELVFMVEHFQKEKQTRGIARAVASLLDEPGDWWIKQLEARERSVDFKTDGLWRRNLIALGLGMSEVLSIRDALIISLVARTGNNQKEDLLALASYPHRPSNVELLYRILQEAFENENHIPDLVRSRRGVAMLDSMIELMPMDRRVQPLAVAAYICWWNGDEEASDYVRRALSLEHDCTLAAIISSAVEHQILPAWQERQGRH